MPDIHYMNDEERRLAAIREEERREKLEAEQREREEREKEKGEKPFEPVVTLDLPPWESNRPKETSGRL